MRRLKEADCQLVSGGVFDVGDMVKFLLGRVVYISLTPNDLSYHRSSLKLFIDAGAMLGGYNLGRMGAEYGGPHLGGKIAGFVGGTLLGCVGGALGGGLAMKIYGNITQWVYDLFDDSPT